MNSIKWKNGIGYVDPYISEMNKNIDSFKHKIEKKNDEMIKEDGN
jgi:hypothetical protein